MNCLSLKLNVTHDNHVTITWPVVLYLVLCECINTVSQCQQWSVDVSSLPHPGSSVWGHGSSLWSSKVDETHFRMSHLSAEASCARLLVDKYLRRCNKKYNISLFSVCPSACLSFSLIPLPYLEDSMRARWCCVGLSRMLGTLLVPRRKHTQQLFRWLGLNIDQSKQLGHMDKTHTGGSACYLVSGEPTDHEPLVTVLTYGQWSRGLEQVPNSFVVNLKTENISLTYTAKYISL